MASSVPYLYHCVYTLLHNCCTESPGLSIELEIIQDLLELSQLDIIEILDREWFDAFGTSPLSLPTEPIDHVDYKVDDKTLQLKEVRSRLLDGIKKEEE